MKWLAIPLMLCSLPAHAGLLGLTIHSRANCGNNESISWDVTKAWELRTESYHYNVDTNEYHKAGTSAFVLTHRSAAVHWGEPKNSEYWVVTGIHWAVNEKGIVYKLGEEQVDDCSIYNGWWD